MADYWNYIIVAVLVLLSGTFSGLTLGMFSLHLTDLERKIKLGNRKAKRVYTIRKHGNLLLCTLLLGNVAVNSAMAIFLGSIATGFVAMSVSTGLIVIFGEILPQATFSRYALSIGSCTTWLVWIFIVLLFPVAFPLAWVLNRILGKELATIWSKTEIKEIIKYHEDSPNSALDHDEERILIGALSFSDKQALDVMTPQSVVYCLKADRTMDSDLLADIRERAFSRIPVFKKEINNIVGIIYTKSLVGLTSSDQTVLDLAKTSNLLPIRETMKLDRLFNLFISRKNHIAFAYDEFGVFVGLVTLEDVIEEILNTEIMDEVDQYEDMQELARKRFSEKVEE